jgi:hypothetical protein
MHIGICIAIVPNWGLKPCWKKIADMNIKGISYGLRHERAGFAAQDIFYAAFRQAALSLKGSNAAKAFAQVRLYIFGVRASNHA